MFFTFDRDGYAFVLRPCNGASRTIVERRFTNFDDVPDYIVVNPQLREEEEEAVSTQRLNRSCSDALPSHEQDRRL